MLENSGMIITHEQPGTRALLAGKKILSTISDALVAAPTSPWARCRGSMLNKCPQATRSGSHTFLFFIHNPEIGDLLRVAASGNRLRQSERERVKSTLTLRRLRASLNPHVGKRGDDRFGKILSQWLVFISLW